MKKGTALSIARSLIAGFAIFCVASTVRGQTTSVKLPTNNSSSSFEVQNSSGTPLFEVDGSGQVSCAPIISFLDDTSIIDVTSRQIDINTAPHELKTIEINVPAAGVVRVHVEGSVRWSGSNSRAYRAAVMPYGTGTNWTPSVYSDFNRHTVTFEDTDTLAVPLTVSRNFTVYSGGTYKYSLCMDTLDMDSSFQLRYPRLTAIYYPN